MAPVAITGGNTYVMKPSVRVSLTTMKLVKLTREAIPACSDGCSSKARPLSSDTCTTRLAAPDAHVFLRQFTKHFQVHEKFKEFRAALLWANVLRICLRSVVMDSTGRRIHTLPNVSVRPLRPRRIPLTPRHERWKKKHERTLQTLLECTSAEFGDTSVKVLRASQ